MHSQSDFGYSTGAISMRCAACGSYKMDCCDGTGKPLNVIVYDEHGQELCRCSLADFIADNDFDDGEIGALRTRIAKGEEWSYGGGAAPFFTVSRAEG